MSLATWWANRRSRKHKEEAFICLYFGNQEECHNCGGWTKVEGGPFEGDFRFCSEECFEEMMEFQSQREAERVSDWCPECGYDNHEHDLDCEVLAQKGTAA